MVGFAALSVLEKASGPNIHSTVSSVNAFQNGSIVHDLGLVAPTIIYYINITGMLQTTFP